MPTERLYYDAPFLLSFQARVLERCEIDGRPAVILDRTAFYPTSGGQPHDLGTLNDVLVVDVRESADQVVHLVEETIGGEIVHGKVDGERRFDHMQQHTGQHILSQAFIEFYDAETVGFHLSEEYSSIDVDRTGFSQQDLYQVEERVNEIVFADLPVIARFVSLEELSELPLRKPPTEHDRIRIVEVAGFDWSACGGTHCQRTGQVGSLRITHFERRGTDTRVTFLCGWRAVHDARWKHQALVDMAGPLSVGLPDLPVTVARLVEAEETARKGLARARKALLHYEARDLYQQAEAIGPARAVWAVLPDHSPDEARLLAREIAAIPGGVALLGVTGETGRLFFARSDDLPWDMGHLVREAAAVIGGRGGGRPHEAQGGGPEAGRLEEALRHALEHLRASQEGA
jgi:alanyl-tRNA synthetase